MRARRKMGGAGNREHEKPPGQQIKRGSAGGTCGPNVGVDASADAGNGR